MTDASIEFCRKLISDLIIPAFCTQNGCIVAANKHACDLLPSSPVGKSVYDFFPEAKDVAEYSDKTFDVVSLNGIETVSVSAFSDFELWQLKPCERPTFLQEDSLAKNEVSLLFAQINLLQRHCQGQSEMFSAIYQSCCKLLKATSSDSESEVLPVLYVFDLAKETERFISECKDVFNGLDISVEKGEFSRFTYISADKNLLDNVFSGVLCLCAHETNRGGSITISVLPKNGRVLLSFSFSSTEKENPTPLSESDKLLTRKILQKNLSKINSTFFSVSDGEIVSFIISFPSAEDEFLFSDCPVFPSVGIPAYLIQLSALLPPEFYSELN